jgi:hypothetical protein
MIGPSEKLKAKWNKKLTDSGFVDIENKDGSLKAEADPRTIAKAFVDGRAEYYSEALAYLDRNLLSHFEQKVWRAHCEGISFRTIALVLRITFYRVRNIVIKHQKLAGLRK